MITLYLIYVFSLYIAAFRYHSICMLMYHILQLPLFLLLFLILYSITGRPGKSCLLIFLNLLVQMYVTSTKHNLPCVFMSCVLKMSSNDRFKPACRILLFNH